MFYSLIWDYKKTYLLHKKIGFWSFVLLLIIYLLVMRVKSSLITYKYIQSSFFPRCKINTLNTPAHVWRIFKPSTWIIQIEWREDVWLLSFTWTTRFDSMKKINVPPNQMIIWKIAQLLISTCKIKIAVCLDVRLIPQHRGGSNVRCSSGASTAAVLNLVKGID